jgi:thioredoxin reductase
MRRRNAPRAADQSDVTRFRGVAIAAAAGALATAAVVLALSDPSARRGSPGPLQRPHQVAKLACASCHNERPIAAACTGCNGAHPSTRAAHAELAAAGALGCADCHAGHGAGGVTFLADGRAIRYGAGGEAPLATSLFHPRTPVTVPLVAAAACARCHDAGSPRDPIAACLVAGQAPLGRARPTVCFDEHRLAGDEDAPRSAAWEAAREVAAIAPLAPAAPAHRSGPWLWLGLGALVSGAAFGGTRLRHRRLRRAPEPAPAVRPPEVVRLPTINASTCIGCRACVDACPYDVLEIHRYVAEVVRPADCCGLTLCEQKCPNGSLVMGDGVPAAGQVAVSDALESREVPGLYFAGDVTGMPLIRNAINQGAHAVAAIADSLAQAKRDTERLDLVIVGAGPAGLSAALAAKARGLRTLVVEQGSVADSIRSFPRGKLVFDQPLDLPLVGALWLAESTKEELLGRWLRIVRQEQLPIREGVRVTSIERDGPEGFAITTAEGKIHRTRRVLLATGRRGSPRRLAIAIPPAWADHVHYSLADAESFAGRRVLVVGLGDVAMETAIALSRQAGTTVTVSYRGDDFHRGKARNVAEMRRRAAAGTLRILFQSQVARLEPGRAVLASPAGDVEIPCDSVFVMIGRAAQIAEPGRPFLALTPEIRPEAS